MQSAETLANKRRREKNGTNRTLDPKDILGSISYMAGTAEATAVT